MSVGCENAKVRGRRVFRMRTSIADSNSPVGGHCRHLQQEAVDNRADRGGRDRIKVKYASGNPAQAVQTRPGVLQKCLMNAESSRYLSQTGWRDGMYPSRPDYAV